MCLKFHFEIRQIRNRNLNMKYNGNKIKTKIHSLV